jgi:hypothetical protein
MFDDDAVGRDDEDKQDEVSLELDRSGSILSAIEKAGTIISASDIVTNIVSQLRKIIRAIRSSPQRKQGWLNQVMVSRSGESSMDGRQRLLMLILDVKTRWSSTHQMMRKSLSFVRQSCSLSIHNTGRALQYQTEIDDFVGRNRDLRSLELDEEEWVTIAQVADWLMAFWSATTQMSTSKTPMLSTTHAIFRGLQEHIREIYCDIPTATPPKIKAGLLDAHKKLSDYYYKYDQSPFYTWAACEFPILLISYVECLS